MADINVVSRIEISQRLSSSGGVYYITHTPAGSTRFDNLNDAISEAKEASAEAALKEARSRGAAGELTVDTSIARNKMVSNWGSGVSMGCTVVSEVTVRAVG
jgi:hypothetical protein